MLAGTTEVTKLVEVETRTGFDESVALDETAMGFAAMVSVGVTVTGVAVKDVTGEAAAMGVAAWSGSGIKH